MMLTIFLINKTLIRLILIYSSETCLRSQKDENLLNTFERKAIKNVIGAIRERYMLKEIHL